MNRINYLIILILVLGLAYRILFTANGNFLFTMDNARDFVDVREMVELGKVRLTGPTSAIEGFYNGPAWYYLLAISYILSGGAPFSAIVMEIFLWAVGGFFLLKLVSRWGVWMIVVIGMLWVASNYIFLATLYSFNPNPVTLLTPLFIYLLLKYLENGRVLFGVATFLLGGLFFNFEMNFGIFTPLIIILAVLLTKKAKLFTDKSFWLGVAFFILTLLPQVFFDLRHQFIMSKSILRHLSEGGVKEFNPIDRIRIVSESFYNTFVPTLMNRKFLPIILLVLFIPILIKFFKQEKKGDPLIVITLLYIFVPFFSYLVLPVAVNPWHLGGPMTASLILVAFVLDRVKGWGVWGRLTFVLLSSSIVFFAVLNIVNFFQERGTPSNDPSLYKNEIAAIDYIYKYANGQNFKAYAYLPSVIDYPYQYLIWWYGRKKYSYVPGEYAYSPNKPQYISNKAKFEGRKDDFSGLVFLIKEPDRIRMRQAWENDFQDMKLIDKHKFGDIEVEVRTEVLKQ